MPSSIHHVSIATVRTQTPGGLAEILSTVNIPESLSRSPTQTVSWTAAVLFSNHLFQQQATGLMRSWEWSMEGCDGRGSKQRKAEEVPIYNSC